MQLKNSVRTALESDLGVAARMIFPLCKFRRSTVFVYKLSREELSILTEATLT